MTVTSVMKELIATTTTVATGTSKLWFGGYAHAFLPGNPKGTLLIERTDLKILLLTFSENVVRYGWRKQTKKVSFITKTIRIFYFKYLNHVQYLLDTFVLKVWYNLFVLRKKAVAFNFVVDMIHPWWTIRTSTCQSAKTAD